MTQEKKNFLANYTKQTKAAYKWSCINSPDTLDQIRNLASIELGRCKATEQTRLMPLTSWRVRVVNKPTAFSLSAAVIQVEQE